MPIDSNIAMGFRLPEAQNPLNALAQVMQVQGAQNQNALAQYSLKKAQRSDEETNNLATLLKTPGFDLNNPEHQAQAYGVAPTMAATFIKGNLDNRATMSKIGEQDVKTTDAVMKQYRDGIGNVNDASGASNLVQAAYADPRISKLVTAQFGPMDQALTKIPTDPAAFQQWKSAFSVGGGEYTKLNKPSIHIQNLNNASNVLSTPGMGGPPTTLSSTPMGVSPNTVANNTTTLMVNGMGPDGATSADVQTMAEGIASGKLAPINGFALAKPRGQAIMAKVMELNPNYDAGDYASKNAALKDFATGKTGTALRSFNVAIDHLGQLSQMADALHNGDMQALNKVGNYFSQQTGNPAVTNFEAVRAIVGKEVVKAIVAGGGGVEERKELSDLLAAAKSPAQLKGVIEHFTGLMEAQKHGLMDQYQRTTGRTDGEKVFAASKRAEPGMKEGAESMSKSGKPIVMRGGKWEYK